MKRLDSIRNIYDVIGVGIGAFNLGLAALLTKVPDIRYQFFDKNQDMSWHDGMLLEDSILQVSYLKDLATLADPTNPWSFLSYLSNQGHLYQFLNRKSDTVSRREYQQYYRWAARKIPGLSFGQAVQKISYSPKKRYFYVETDKSTILSKHISVAVGHVPNIPEAFKPYLGTTVFHSSEYISKVNSLNLTGKRVVIIGGGQSGAEVMNTLLSSTSELKSLTWMSRRLNFLPMEDACFSNEFYTPKYVEYFYQLSEVAKKRNLQKQKITCDGISQELIDTIYRKLYNVKHVEHRPLEISLLPNHTFNRIDRVKKAYQLAIQSNDTQITRHIDADVVILCTGYERKLPDCLTDFLEQHQEDAHLKFNKDYSLSWKHQKTNKLFLQNFNLNSHGISDPNLSLSAWRNATIINSVLGEDFYSNHSNRSFFSHVQSQQAKLLTKEKECQ